MNVQGFPLSRVHSTNFSAVKNFDMRQSAQEREFSNTARQQEGGETERQIYALSKREQFKLIQWGTHTVVLF